MGPCLTWWEQLLGKRAETTCRNHMYTRRAIMPACVCVCERERKGMATHVDPVSPGGNSSLGNGNGGRRDISRLLIPLSIACSVIRHILPMCGPICVYACHARTSSVPQGSYVCVCVCVSVCICWSVFAEAKLAAYLDPCHPTQHLCKHVLKLAQELLGWHVHHVEPLGAMLVVEGTLAARMHTTRNTAVTAQPSGEERCLLLGMITITR